MKKYLVLIFLMISCNNNKLTKPPAITNHEIATLENNFTVVGCAQFAFSFEYIFKIKSNDSLIIGIINCPGELGSDFLKVDSNYALTIFKDGPTNKLKYYSIVNHYDSINYPIYFVADIKRANNQN